jgi:hypothetical protein
MNAVKAHQMGIRLHRAEVIDRNNLDILPALFHDGAHHVASDPAKSVDCDPDHHSVPSIKKNGAG